MDDNEARHEILKNILFMNHDIDKDKDPLTTAVEFNELVNYQKGDKDKREKALRYLLATGFLEYYRISNLHSCVITQKGIDAFNGEFFKSIHEEEKRKRTNNRWMIRTNAILAVGVIYSIFHDNFKCSEKVSDKTQTKLVHLCKKEYPVLNPGKTYPFSHLSAAKDSLKSN